MRQPQEKKVALVNLSNVCPRIIVDTKVMLGKLYEQGVRD